MVKFKLLAFLMIFSGWTGISPLYAATYSVDDPKGYLQSIKAQGIPGDGWSLSQKDKVKVLMATYTAPDGQWVSFLFEPGTRCFMSDENGTVLYGGDIKTFFSYSRPGGSYEDKFKSGEYKFCLNPFILAASSPEYRDNFDQLGSTINIPRTCTSREFLNEPCVQELVTSQINRNINNRFDVQVNKKAGWVTDKIQQQA
ncbi:MAG: hypothetical protein V2A70_00835, partial [Candidatus Omnitrophota bacterium]